jgi:hypothetical protein
MFDKLKIGSGRVAVLLLAGLMQVDTNAQILKPEIFIETGFKVSAGENTPYYSISNKHGIFSDEKNAFLLRSGIIAATDTSKRISISYGLDGIYRFDTNSEIYLQQAFVRTKIYFLIIQGGLVEETFGNQDDQLSSGAYLFSGNARPMPKIALFTNDYVTLPYTNNLWKLRDILRMVGLARKINMLRTPIFIRSISTSELAKESSL